MQQDSLTSVIDATTDTEVYDLVDYYTGDSGPTVLPHK